MDKKIIEWINKDLDGMLSPGKKKRLAAVLKKNTTAHQFFHNLKKSFLLLEKLSPVDPSPDLKERIQNNINQNRYAVKKNSSQPSPVPKSVRRFNPGWAISFAAGIIIAVIVVLLHQSGLTLKKDMDVNDLYGTVGLREDMDFRITGKIPINHPNITGAILQRQSHQLIGLEIDLKTTLQSDIHVEFNPEQINFTGLKPLHAVKLSLENDTRCVKTTVWDENHFILLFQRIKPDTTLLSLKVIQTENVLIIKKMAFGIQDKDIRIL